MRVRIRPGVQAFAGLPGEARPATSPGAYHVRFERGLDGRRLPSTDLEISTEVERERDYLFSAYELDGLPGDPPRPSQRAM